MGSAAQLRKPFDVAELRAAVLEGLANEPFQETQLAQNDLANSHRFSFSKLNP